MAEPAPKPEAAGRSGGGGGGGALQRGIEALGRPAVRLVVEAARFATLLGEAMLWVAAGWTYGAPVRPAAVARQIVDMGVSVLPLTVIFALAIGLVLGMQASQVLELVDMLPPIVHGLAVALARQVAPLLMGILVAARSGSAIAAGLGSMVVGQEITALRAMGINPVRFLVAPALVAMVVVTPLLTVLLTALTLLTVGTYLAATAGTSALFVFGTAIEGLTVGAGMVGLLKSIIFAALITGIAATVGLAAKGGSADVGQGVTRAIVGGITAILIANAVLSVLFPD